MFLLFFSSARPLKLWLPQQPSHTFKQIFLTYQAFLAVPRKSFGLRILS